ncbi:MAG: hypothetical protein NT038_07375 [Euryarchaeota archaeon]|nr:hypothetical protein [Euryarchaeota archaeon]
MDNVTVAMLPSLHNSVNIHNYVEVFNSFVLPYYSLTPVTTIYNEIPQGKTIYFLDAQGTPISVSSIQKESYDGPIYDVDVPNDIVLVRRGNDSAFWSGNSDTQLQQFQPPVHARRGQQLDQHHHIL